MPSFERHHSKVEFRLVLGIVLGIILSQSAGVVYARGSLSQPTRTFEATLQEGYFELHGFRDRLERTWISLRPPLEDNEIGAASSIYLKYTGSVYHPRLMEWSGSGRLTFRERRFTQLAANSSRNFSETLQNYNLSATFLKARPVNLKINATRNTSSVDADFTATTLVKTRGYGAGLYSSIPGLTQNLTLTKYRYLSEGFVTNEEDRVTLAYSGVFRRERLHSQARIEYDDVDFITSNLGFIGRTARWQSSARLNEKRLWNVSGGVSFFDRGGATSTRYTQTNIATNLSPVKSVKSSVSFAHRRNVVERVDSRVNTITASVVHQLYQSLTSTLSSDWVETDFDNGAEREVRPRASFNYRKQTSFGQMAMRYSFSYRKHDETLNNPSPRSMTSQITYLPGQPIILTGGVVDTATIIVGNVDSSALFIYQNGLDYRVSEIGGQAEVTPLSTGAIVSGDRLTFSYQVLIDESLEFDEYTNRYGLTLNFKQSVTLTADRGEQRQQPRAGDPRDRLDNNITDNYSLAWTRGELRVRADYRRYRSGRNPYKLRSASGDWSKQLSQRVRTSVGVTRTVTDFTDRLERSIINSFSGNIWFRQSRRLLVTGRASYVKRQGRRDDGHSLVFSGRARADFPLISGEFRIDYYDQKVDIVGDDDRLNVRLTIRRTIK